MAQSAEEQAQYLQDALAIARGTLLHASPEESEYQSVAGRPQLVDRLTRAETDSSTLPVGKPATKGAEDDD